MYIETISMRRGQGHMQHHMNHTETRGIDNMSLVHSMLQSSVWGKPQPDSYVAVTIEEKLYDAELMFNRVKGMQTLVVEE